MISGATGAIASESQAFRYRDIPHAFGIYHFRIQPDRTGANRSVDRMDEVIIDFAKSRGLDIFAIGALNKTPKVTIKWVKKFTFAT